MNVLHIIYETVRGWYEAFSDRFLENTIAEDIKEQLEYGGGSACFYDPATGRRECE